MDVAAPQPHGRFLTVADVAEVLNVSATEVYALIRGGELPAIRVGAAGHWRVEGAVLEGYIDARYEETRRIALWNQADFGDLPELLIARAAPDADIRRPGER